MHGFNGLTRWISHLLNVVIILGILLPGGVSFDFFGVGEDIHHHPTQVSPSLLDHWVSKSGTRISGSDFYAWYLMIYEKKDGWWWGMFGKDVDGFTIWDSFALIFYYEAQLYWTNPNIQEASVRKANEWCLYIYHQPCLKTEQYINWFAHEYQSAGNWVRAGYPLKDYGKEVGFGDEEIRALKDAAAAFTDHPEDWDKGCTWERPCGWANHSLYQDSPDIQDQLYKNQPALFLYSPGDRRLNPWIIPSGCAYFQWIGGVQESMLDFNATCPNVR